MIRNSLRGRLLTASALVLTAFVAITAYALDQAFRNSLLQAEKEKLQGLVYALLGSAAPREDGELSIALDAVPDPRLRQPLSGLDAALFDERGHAVWSSAAFLDLPQPTLADVGQWQFERLSNPDVFSLSFGLRWIDLARDPRRYSIVVLETTQGYREQMATFRRTLWGWLGGTAMALTAMLLFLQRWSLAPLLRLGRELQEIEAGNQDEIAGRYPDELRPLTHDLNAMIVNERNQQLRYRNALGDLAHTLKTPLAVLSGMTQERGLNPVQREQLQEQVTRMQRIVDHQLRRAAAAGTRTLSKPLRVRPLIEKIAGALTKVYADKNPRFDLQITPNLKLRADQGDLYELIGNLLDNAAKYGNGRVRVSSRVEDKHCSFVVEDDGPGFPENPELLLERGMRADDQTPGQGIGLAAVAELIKAYEGHLELGRSALLGGGKVTATLPLR
ncbi:HAMP domain-containing protein [Solimonas sp. K1W22B-7]|uniref:ATP-binding protein n=1 Tax=Solimonas sp. K1W22B-7 TaxID=2303331 RepID=UPI000E3379E3|nr:ATP-binding protein [Solimonas sp. K1W22B-7]AXQ29536.1 HAMP domain-containing protein [Solimonas sp. K1W22B-7]